MRVFWMLSQLVTWAMVRAGHSELLGPVSCLDTHSWTGGRPPSSFCCLGWCCGWPLRCGLGELGEWEVSFCFFFFRRSSPDHRIPCDFYSYPMHASLLALTTFLTPIIPPSPLGWIYLRAPFSKPGSFLFPEPIMTEKQAASDLPSGIPWCQ